MRSHGFFRRPSLAEGAIVLLLATLFAACLTMIGQIQSSKERVVSRTLEDARNTSRLAAAATAQYAESVSGIVQSDQVEFVWGPNTSATSLHLPITFTRNLAARFSDASPGATFKIYSDYPFDGHQNRQLDAFANTALGVLSDPSVPEFWAAVPGENGSLRVRYAVPLVMQDGCVECHNNGRWTQSRTDWQVGDVRGVREITIDIPAEKFAVSQQVLTMFALIAMAVLTTVFILLPVVRREVDRSSHFHQLNQELSEQAVELERATITDALSNLSNRRGFDQIMEHIAAQHSAAVPRKLGFILFDIDHFKQVNDTHGHAAGDEVIAAIGLALRDNTRPDDCAARIGGEEFAIMVPEANVSDMVDLADRIRMQIARLRFASAHGHFSVTISAGATELRPEDTPDDCFERADQLLYQAKANGRNRVASSLRVPSRPTSRGASVA